MSQRFIVAGILGGLVAVVALVVVILGPGRYHPSPGSLRDDPQPAIPGRLVYADEDNCIQLAEASGATRRELHCAGDIAFVTWVDAQHIAYAEYRQNGIQWTVLNIETGQSRDAGQAEWPQWPGPNFTSVNGEEAVIDFPSGDLYRITDGERTRIFDYEGSENRTPSIVGWSPDGEYVLLSYYERGFDDLELWIVSRDGSVAGTLADDVRGTTITASWWIDGAGFAPPVDDLPELE